jgi:hypothetical protein
VAKRYFTVEHVITAGQQFTGAASGGALTSPSGADNSGGDFHKLYTYATSNAGGLINPVTPGTLPARVRMIERIGITMSGQSAWSIQLLDQADAVRQTPWSGTTETTYSFVGPRPIVPGEKLKMTTTGMTGAGKLTVLFSEEV